MVEPTCSTIPSNYPPLRRWLTCYGELSGLRSVAPSRVPPLAFKGTTASKEFISDEFV
jgi:hypothetical protein